MESIPMIAELHRSEIVRPNDRWAPPGGRRTLLRDAGLVGLLVCAAALYRAKQGGRNWVEVKATPIVASR